MNASMRQIFTCMFDAADLGCSNYLETGKNLFLAIARLATVLAQSFLIAVQSACIAAFSLVVALAGVILLPVAIISVIALFPLLAIIWAALLPILIAIAIVIVPALVIYCLAKKLFSFLDSHKAGAVQYFEEDIASDLLAYGSSSILVLGTAALLADQGVPTQGMLPSEQAYAVETKDIAAEMLRVRLFRQVHDLDRDALREYFSQADWTERSFPFDQPTAQSVQRSLPPVQVKPSLSEEAITPQTEDIEGIEEFRARAVRNYVPQRCYVNPQTSPLIRVEYSAREVIKQFPPKYLGTWRSLPPVQVKSSLLEEVITPLTRPSNQVLQRWNKQELRAFCETIRVKTLPTDSKKQLQSKIKAHFAA